MRIRTRKNIRKKNGAMVFFFLLPLIGTLMYASVVVYILYDVSSYTFGLDPPDTQYFYGMDEIDDDRLEEMAHIFDYRNYKFNAPIGISVAVTFKDNSYSYDAIDYWHHTDNGAEANSYSICAIAYRYKVALDNGDMEAVAAASEELRFFVKCMGNMIAAPNGGLGINPETGDYYPGILSRFACSYEDAVKYHTFMLEEHERHHWGLGNYSDWRVRLKTSRDEVSAYYLAWASVLKFIDPTVDDNSQWCVDHVKLMVNQVLHHWKLESNWLVLDFDGSPTGSDINGADWRLIALKIGAIANPEKYESLYQYAAAKMLDMNDVSMGDWANNAFEYYGLGLGAQNFFSLILLEDNPQLLNYFISLYDEGFYNMVKYHRQLYFNAIYLVFMEILDSINPSLRARFVDPQYSDEMIRWDLLDQLWRFHTSNFCPMRNYNLDQRPHSTRSTSLNPEMRKLEIYPNMDNWQQFFNNNSTGTIFAWVGDAFNLNTKIYKIARTVSEYWAGPMIWQNNPFMSEGGNPNSDGLTEEPGTSYTIVYWMLRAYGII